MKTSKDMINYINQRLNCKVTRISESCRYNNGLCLSKAGEAAVTERWNKSEKNGGYNQLEREMV